MATIAPTKNSSDIISIKPFADAPITKIPMYLFENYNSKTYNSYNPGYLALLKTKASVINPSEILTFKIDDSEKIKKAKEFDWIYALDKLENEYLSNPEVVKGVLKVENILTLHGYISRLAKNKTLRTNPNFKHTPGKFRDFIVRKNIQSLNPTEIKVVTSLEILLIANFHGPVRTILNSISSYYITLSQIKLSLTINNDSLTKISPTRSDSKIDYKLLDEWADKRGIEIIKWLKERMYYYTDPSNINFELERVFQSINDPKMHPIEKAAKIWFDIVKIKPFLKANKKTAKVLAFAILLLNGYLPPLLFGEEEQKKLFDCLFVNNSEENSHLKLTKFLSDEIFKTQEKIKADGSALSDFSFEKKEK